MTLLRRCFLFWLNYRLFSTAALCVCRKSHWRGILSKVETTQEPHATGPPVPGHLGNAIFRPMPRKVLLAWVIGLNMFLRPASWCSGTWFTDLHLITFQSFLKEGDSTRWNGPFLRTINLKIALL